MKNQYSLQHNESDIDDLLNDPEMESLVNEFNSDEEEIATPLLQIDMDSVNNEAKTMANIITERLSNYYFDQKYIDSHPYIPTKIMTEMNNIRRLIKMLDINEKAQDALITSISINAGKGTLYASLTSLQNSMLSIQTQLNNLINSLEDIFRKMQEECDKTFAQKDHEEQADGSVIVRGSRDFIRSLNEKLYNSKLKIEESNTGN